MINSKIETYLYLFGLMLIITILLITSTSIKVFGQTHNGSEFVDTAPIELYLKVADHVRKNGTVDQASVKEYFGDPIIAIFKHRPGFDSLKFISDLVRVYSNKYIPESAQDDEYKLMLKYKQNEAIIRKRIAQVKKIDIEENVKKRLRHLYPSSFNLDLIHLRFVYLFLDEGNGGVPGYVFNSALQTAYLANENIDLISSHEAYHTITNSIFMERYKGVFAAKANDTLTNDQNLLWYMQIVSEEGIADLIDKKILSAGSSPLAVEIKKLRLDEVSKCEQKIHQLDSLLSDTTKKLNFLTINNIIQNGGHIPGRYMAEVIKKGDLLEEYVKHTGNPFQFFYLYNEASKDPSSARFSAKSIAKLKALEIRLKEL